MRFYFDVWTCLLWTLASFYGIWACLHSPYAWFITCFPVSVLGFNMRYWLPRLDFFFSFLNSFEVHFNSPPTSKLVDGNMKRGLYGFILILLLVLCSCCFPCFWFVMEDGYYFWGIKVSWVEWDCGLWVLRRGEGKLWDPICMSKAQVEFISGILWNSEELPTSCKHLSLHSWSYGMPLSLAHLSSTAPCKCHACYLQCYHSAWDGGAWICWKSSNMASFRWVR